MSDDKENFVRMTRAATKRKAAMADEDRLSKKKKKRVVLGELPNLCNKRKQTRKPLRVPKKQNKKTSKSDVDTRSDDPQMCAPYVTGIFVYLRQLEVKEKSRPLIDYIEKVQKDVTPNMRGVLVDWLVEVAEEYKLLSDTLYLAVSYIDRFLSLRTVNRQKLQLLGVSAMLIASKYEEITPPNVEDFCYITDNTYTKQEIVKMEADVLLALQFELGNPTTNTFLRRFTRVAQEDFNMSHLQMEFLCSYLSELSMLDYNSLKFLPSVVAASAVYLARFIIRPKQHPWSVMLEEYTRYKAGDLRECVCMIHDLYLSRKGAKNGEERGYAGVPPTVMVECLHPGFNHPKGVKTKIGSLQMFTENDGSCEDMGPASFPVEEVHKISVLDIRLANADRHGGNILMSKDKEGKIVLVPIDHGYCLPESFEDCTFEWLYWSQARKPYSRETLDYIRSLNAEEDINLLKFHGWKMPLKTARTLRISTMLLKKGAERGLTAFEIGNMMCRETLSKKSLVEEMVEEAQEAVLPGTSEAAFLEALSDVMDYHLDEVVRSQEH